MVLREGRQSVSVGRCPGSWTDKNARAPGWFCVAETMTIIVPWEKRLYPVTPLQQNDDEAEKMIILVHFNDNFDYYFDFVAYF